MKSKFDENFGQVQESAVSVYWVNKLELHDASSRYKLVQLPGDVYTLALSNRLMILGSQTNHFFTQKMEDEGIFIVT